MAERERDVLALLGERAGDALRHFADLVGDQIADRGDVVRQIEMDAGDGVAHVLGLIDQRLALVGQLAEQVADAHFVVVIGALERGDFVVHQRFQLGRARERAFDAVAHGGDFAADGLADRHDRLARGVPPAAPAASPPRPWSRRPGAAPASGGTCGRARRRRSPARRWRRRSRSARQSRRAASRTEPAIRRGRDRPWRGRRRSRRRRRRRRRHRACAPAGGARPAASGRCWRGRHWRARRGGCRRNPRCPAAAPR